MTACKEKAIYKSANHERWIVFITSGIGMLLMLLCCLVIFQQIRKDMRRKAAAEQELKMAAQVQLSLLKAPSCKFQMSRSKIVAFMRPAKEAGGDLYDYAEIFPSKSSPEGILFCIGDVSGKGMPAALFMTQVVSLFRNAVRSSSEPVEIVSQMNDVLAADNQKMTFCTFFVGFLRQAQEPTLTFCNAGHNPPVFVSETTKFLKVLPNLALGLMEGYQYKQETIDFPEGSRLVCYTDGVTEAKNRRHQQYGERRLLDVLANIGTENCEEINNRIVRSVEQFVGKAVQSDDITLLQVEC